METFLLILFTVLAFLMAIVPIAGGIFVIVMWVIFAGDPDIGILLFQMGFAMLVVSGGAAIVGFAFGNPIWFSSNIVIALVVIIIGSFSVFGAGASVAAGALSCVGLAIGGYTRKRIPCKCVLIGDKELCIRKDKC